MTHDGELRERFAALRNEDAGLVPPFAMATPATAPGRRWPGWAVAATLAAAAAAALWLITREGPVGERWTLDLGTVVWQAPTDFLLETPGRDLLRRLPDIGVVKAY